MSVSAGVPTAQAALSDGAVAPALFVLFTGGLVGMSIKNVFDSILSDDADPPETDEEVPDGGGLMGEEGDDEFGDLGDLDGDEDDPFGDDEFGDGLDEDGDGGPDTDELDHRLDELESEVGSLSSTVNTVRTENEKISESVDEVEENVRKLLDIYEMVTRGVNPFADDVGGMDGGMGGAGDSSFGLFDDDGGGEEDAAVDEDIANADAEGFFDEDLVEDDGDDFDAGGDPSDVFPDDEGDADADEDDDVGDDGGEFATDDDALDDGEAEGGKSFQELKDEYETGEADWAGEGEEPPAEEDDAAADEDDEVAVDDDAIAVDDEALAAADEELADPVEDDGPADDAARAESEAAPDPEPTTAPEPDPEPTTDPEPATHSEPEATRDADAGKPYLAALPQGFAGDLLVVEWLEYLCSEAGYRETARAIDYYERIDWIGEAVADDLHEVLRGFDGAGGGEGLTIDHHRRSLAYISQLDGDGGQSVATTKLVGGGGLDGLQR